MSFAGIINSIKSRNVLVILNTAVAAAASVVLLLGAARAMDQRALSDFSLVQLLVVTAVMLQRSTLLSPALATQRMAGRTVIPLAWAARVSLPAAVVVAGCLSVAFGSDGGHYIQWFFAGLAAGGAALVQDTVRYGLLSRGLTSVAVLSDAFWLLLILATLIAPVWFADPLVLTFYWGLTGVASVAIGLIPLVFQISKSAPPPTRASIRKTWRLGKWSGIDAVLSAAATLMPMLFTAFVLGSAEAGTYRVLQSALGPINILCTSMITLFGLDSWQLTTAEQLKLLSKRVTRAVIAMIAFTTAYVAFAEILMIGLSGISSPELLRIAVIVGVVGIIGSATSPVSAASLALGYQRHGAVLRFVIVVFALLASFASAVDIWLPWNDPIGTVTLFAAAAGLAGWLFSYKIAMKRETNALVTGVAERHWDGIAEENRLA
ncbi:UNVERIFIED_ORG: O-antigen/teichoic acid export membrane protein [Arthrobacter globiformis]|nr:O-antigen/teichoic acid export membrane protein [Arthrobacter globiformis]